MALIAIVQVLKETGVDDITEYIVFGATEVWKFVSQFIRSMLHEEVSYDPCTRVSLWMAALHRPARANTKMHAVATIGWK